MAEAEKIALVAQLALQRSDMTSSRNSLTQELSVSRQFKKSLRNNPTPWAIGGVATVLALGILFRRKKIIYSPVPVKAGIIGRTARLVASLARPALTTLALKHAREYAETRFGPFEDNSMLGGPPQK
jgi:DNA-binding LacI/PurR family transcriptional regulator